MTRRQLSRSFRFAIATYGAMFLVGFALRFVDSTPPYLVYATYKDMLPLMVASLASWLGFCLQRRMSYVQQLRILWSKVVDAVQVAQQYTQIPEPSRQEYAIMLLKLSSIIDEVRGVFRNVGESSNKIGQYPFEPIKQMYEIAHKLGYGKLEAATREAARSELFELWRRVRPVLLSEFDRQEPTVALALTPPPETPSGPANPKKPAADDKTL
jgi:hypothetical protein